MHLAGQLPACFSPQRAGIFTFYLLYILTVTHTYHLFPITSRHLGPRGTLGTPEPRLLLE